MNKIRDLISVTSAIGLKTLQIKVLYKTVSTILSEIEESCLQGFSGRTGLNLRINYLSILVWYCYDVLEEKDMSGIR